MSEPDPPPPPPYVGPERRERVYQREINLGAIIQAATVVISVAGSAIGAIFAAGSYVQHIRDDLMSAQKSRMSDDAATNELLQKIIAAARQPIVVPVQKP